MLNRTEVLRKKKAAKLQSDTQTQRTKRLKKDREDPFPFSLLTHTNMSLPSPLPPNVFFFLLSTHLFFFPLLSTHFFFFPLVLFCFSFFFLTPPHLRFPSFFKLFFPCFKNHVLMLKTWNMGVWGTLCPPL